MLAFDSEWLTECEFIRNLRTNFVIRGKLQISRAKYICSYVLKANTKIINDEQLMINNQ